MRRTAKGNQLLHCRRNLLHDTLAGKLMKSGMIFSTRTGARATEEKFHRAGKE